VNNSEEDKEEIYNFLFEMLKNKEITWRIHYLLLNNEFLFLSTKKSYSEL